MQMETKNKRENPLLKRVELEFVLHHPGETTPTRDAVRGVVADALGGSKDNVIVDRLNTEYGRSSTKGYAKLYETKDAALETEPKHLLARNGLITEEA